jgi:hypothetical protein
MWSTVQRLTQECTRARAAMRIGAQPADRSRKPGPGKPHAPGFALLGCSDERDSALEMLASAARWTVFLRVLVSGRVDRAVLAIVAIARVSLLSHG